MPPMRKPRAARTCFAKQSGENAVINPERNMTEALALNWLEGHSRIMGFWLDRLVAENGDIGLIDTLHRQSAWLQSMQDRLAR